MSDAEYDCYPLDELRKEKRKTGGYAIVIPSYPNFLMAGRETAQEEMDEIVFRCNSYEALLQVAVEAGLDKGRLLSSLRERFPGS